MPTTTAQVRPDFTFEKGATIAVEPLPGFQGTYALSYDKSVGPGGEYNVVLYADKDAISAKLVFNGDSAILVDVPAGFELSELQDVVTTWEFDGNGNGSGAPGSVKTHP